MPVIARVTPKTPPLEPTPANCQKLIINFVSSIYRTLIFSPFLPPALFISLDSTMSFRACIVCRKSSAKPRPQLMGQLPLDRITPGIIFEKVGIDYAGPIYIKLGHVRKRTIVKAYICVFVAMSVKAVHLEAVSDLTSTAFIACLWRFIT